MKFELMEQEFFQQPTLQLAKSLLGCLLIKETDEGITGGYIAETEAYMGPDDQAAHSYKNRRTKRTEVMFGEPGYAYTYSMHTHCLINVVSSEQGIPHAILLRALEPEIGIDLMMKRRPVDQIKKLTSGPGKLTKAMGISMDDYGKNLREKPLYIVKGKKPSEISCGPRIGIDGAGEAREYPWRFWITGTRFLSK